MENKLNWTCGSERMPLDFEKTYILKYVSKGDYIGGTRITSFSTICKLTKIDEIGFHFKTYGDVSMPDATSTTVVKIYDKAENTATLIGHENLINTYWAEISLNNSKKKEKLTDLLLEKESLETRLKELETLIEEESVDNDIMELDESYFHEIDKDLREKYDSMLKEAKEEHKDKPNWIFQENDTHLTI